MHEADKELFFALIKTPNALWQPANNGLRLAVLRAAAEATH